jgi:hypothetical protein
MLRYCFQVFRYGYSASVPRQLKLSGIKGERIRTVGDEVAIKDE